MSDDPDNLVLRYLRAIDSKVAALGADVKETKQRLTMIDLQVGQLAGTMHSQYASVMARFDYVEDRLDRLERRAELIEALPTLRPIPHK